MSSYKVKYGDTLSSIAKRKGVSVSALFDANRDRISNPDQIRGGMTLNIPSATKQNKVESKSFWNNYSNPPAAQPEPAATPRLPGMTGKSRLEEMAQDSMNLQIGRQEVRTGRTPATAARMASSSPMGEDPDQLRRIAASMSVSTGNLTAQGEDIYKAVKPPEEGTGTISTGNITASGREIADALLPQTMSGMEGRQFYTEQEKAARRQTGAPSPEEVPLAQFGASGMGSEDFQAESRLMGRAWQQSQIRTLESFKDLEDIPGLPILAEARIAQLESLPDWAARGGPLLQNVVAGVRLTFNFGIQAATRVEELIQTGLFISDINYFRLVKDRPDLVARGVDGGALQHSTLLLPSPEEMFEWRFRGISDPGQLLEDTYSLIYNDDGSINWENLWGKPTSLFSTTAEAAYSNMGIAGLYPTFLAYPDRQEKLVQALIEDDGEKPMWEHLMDYESFLPELVAGIFLDPLWFVPDEIFIAGKKIPNINRAISAIVFPPAPAMELGANALASIWKRSSIRSGVLKTWKRSQFAVFSDDLYDATRTLLAREVQRLGDDFDSVVFFERLFFDPDTVVIGQLSGEQQKMIYRMINLLQDSEIGAVEDLIRVGLDRSWFDHLNLKKKTPSGYSGRIAYVQDVLRDDPLSLLRPAVRMAERQYATSIGLTLHPKGALYRSLNFIQGVLVENWLYNSLRYMMANGMGDWFRMIVAGYRATPFDYNSSERVLRHLDGLGLVVPASVTRIEATEIVDEVGRLRTSELPWPIGDTEGTYNLIRFLSAVFGGDGKVPEKIAGALEKGTLRNFLDVFNYSTLLEGGRRIAWAGEQLRRISCFEQAFSRRMYLEGGAYSRFTKELLQDPEVPSEMLIWLEHGRLRSPQDFDDFIDILFHELPIPARLSAQMPASLDNTSRLIEAVAKRLDEVDNVYTRSATTSTRAFDAVEVGSYHLVDDAMLEGKLPPTLSEIDPAAARSFNDFVNTNIVQNPKYSGSSGYRVYFETDADLVDIQQMMNSGFVDRKSYTGETSFLPEPVLAYTGHEGKGSLLVIEIQDTSRLTVDERGIHLPHSLAEDGTIKNLKVEAGEIVGYIPGESSGYHVADEFAAEINREVAGTVQGDFVQGIQKRLDNLNARYETNLIGDLYRREVDRIFNDAIEELDRAAVQETRRIANAVDFPEQYIQRYAATDDILLETNTTACIYNVTDAGKPIFHGDGAQSFIESTDSGALFFIDDEVFATTALHEDVRAILNGQDYPNRHSGLSVGFDKNNSLLVFIPYDPAVAIVDEEDFLRRMVKAGEYLQNAGIDPLTTIIMPELKALRGSPIAIQELSDLLSIDFLGDTRLVDALQVSPSVRQGLKDLMQLSQEAPVTAAILEPRYVRKNLQQVTSGLMPENVVLRAPFEGLTPEAADALARTYLNSPTGLGDFYQDALTTYNMKYGTNIGEAVSPPAAASRGRQTVLYEGTEGSARNLALPDLLDEVAAKMEAGENVQLFGAYDTVSGRLEWSDTSPDILLDRLGTDIQDTVQVGMVGPKEFMVIGAQGNTQEIAVGLKRMLGQGVPGSYVISYPLRGGSSTLFEAAYFSELADIEKKLKKNQITVTEAEALRQNLLGDFFEGTAEGAEPLNRRQELWKAIQSGEGDTERLVAMLETRRSRVIRNYETDKPILFIDVSEVLQRRDILSLTEEQSKALIAGGEGYSALKGGFDENGKLMWWANYHSDVAGVPVTIPLSNQNIGLSNLEPIMMQINPDDTEDKVEKMLRELLQLGLDGKTPVQILDWRPGAPALLDTTVSEMLSTVTGSLASVAEDALRQDVVARYGDKIKSLRLDASAATSAEAGELIRRLDTVGLTPSIGVVDPNGMMFHFGFLNECPAHGLYEAAGGVELGKGIRFNIDDTGLITFWGAGLNEDVAQRVSQAMLDLGANPTSVVQYRWENVQASGPYAEAVSDGLLRNFAERTTSSGVDVQYWNRAARAWRDDQTSEMLEKYNNLRNGLQEWRRNTRNIGQVNRSAQLRSEAEKNRLAGIVSGYKQRWMEILGQTLHGAEDDVNEVMFDYAIRSRPEGALRGYSPFLTWQIRNPIFWAGAVAQRPILPSIIYTTNRVMEAQRKQMNLTERFKGTAGFKTRDEFMGMTPGYFGVKALSLFDVLGQFQQPFESPGFEPPSGIRGVIYQLMQAGKWVGIRPWPYIDYAFQQLGISPKEGVGELFGSTQRFIDAWLTETGIMPPEGRTETAEFLFYYNLRRRIAEMEAEGLITHTEALTALATQEGEIWESASSWVVKTKNRLMLLSFFIPFGIKYASEGEMMIRENLLKDLPDEDVEYLRTYSLAMQQDPEAALRDLIYYQYEQLLEGLNPASDEYKELMKERHQTLEQAGITATPTVGYRGILGISAFTTAEPLTSYEVYRTLNEYKPKPEHYVVNGEVDWDTYYEELGIFTRAVPNLSAALGYPISDSEWQAHLDKHKTAIQIAYDIHRDEMEAAWDLFEAIQPGGSSFLELALEYVDEEVKEAFAGGMSLEESSAYGAYLWSQVMASGLPRGISDEVLSSYTEARRADQYAAAVRLRLQNAGQGFDESDLSGFEFPGMFGESDDKSEILNYYYDLFPYQQNQVERTLGMPENTYFSEWIREMDDQELRATIARIRQGQRPEVRRNMIPDEGLYSIALNPEFNWVTPTPPEVTPEVAEELKQVRRDWFLYNQVHEQGYTGTWTPLMEKYYGDPTNPKSRFWEVLSGHVLNSVGMNDPILTAVMDRMTRNTYDFTDEQYEAALDHFYNNLDLFVDWPATRERLRENPEWLERAQEEQDSLGSVKLSNLEDLRSEYMNINWRSRYLWEDSRKEEWKELRTYLLYLQAAELGCPYYLYFSKNWEYRNWYGVRPPDELGNLPEQLSERFFQAVWDYESWQNGTGTWTDEMRAFIGPDPERLEVNVENTRPSGGSSSQSPAPAPTPAPGGDSPPPPTQPPWIGSPP